MKPPALDHIVYATPDLAGTVRDMADRLGVEPSEGGRHVGHGTRNFLLALGSGAYLEIIGPDLEQPAFSGTRPFGVDLIERPRIVGWAVQVVAIEEHAAKARTAGYDPGPVTAMTRLTKDGVLLEWKLTRAEHTSFPELVPFLIDWGTTRHPSGTCAQGGRVLNLHLEDPDPDESQAKLRALGVSRNVQVGLTRRIIATIHGPEGALELS